MKKKLPTGLAILIVLPVSALLLYAANGLTRDSIERQAQAAVDAARRQILPAAERFEAVELEEGSGLDGLLAGQDAAGETVGYIGRATVTGYGGPIEVSAGIGMDGTISGVSVGGDAFDETPGLGARTQEAAFTGQFAGKTYGVALNQDGVDGVAGATISSRSVVSGVNAVAKYVNADVLGLIEEEAPTAYLGQTCSATEAGFGGDVTAHVGLAADGTVEYLAIDTPDETDGVGKQCSEPAFTDQFLGKQGPFAYGENDVEAVSGATITSQAALKAINAVINGEGAEDEPPLAATVPGFGGDVTVTVRLNADNSVAALAVDTPNETDGLGKQCSESAFTSQFVGKFAPFAYGADGIDAVSGATVTSTAVLNALNDLVPGGEAAVPASAPDQAATEAPVETEAPAEAAQPDAPDEDAGSDIVGTAPTVAGIESYLRPRPASIAMAIEDAGEETRAAASIEDYLRERPASIAATEATTENETEAESEAGTSIEDYLRARPANIAAPADAAKTESEAEAGASIEDYLRPRPASIAAAVEDTGEEASAAASIEDYLRVRPANIAAPADAAETESEAETEPVVGASIEDYLRPRPASIAAAVEDAGEEASTAASIEGYLRARPASIAATEATTETEAEAEPVAGAAIEDYLRARPASIAAPADAAEKESEAKAEPVAGASIEHYLRPRPASIAGAVEDAGEEASAVPSIEGYLRERPASIAAAEATTGTEAEAEPDAANPIDEYLRERPASAQDIGGAEIAE